MSEIDRQLLKLPNLEDNIKGLVIPTLNFYLNSNQFDVYLSLVSQKRRLGKSWEQWPIS